MKDTKIALAIVPAAKTTPWVCTTVPVDTKGYRQALFIVQLSTQATVQSVATITEGDASNAATDAISGADLSTASVVTGTGNLIVWNLNLRKRKRFLQVNFTGGANVTVSAVCILGKPEVQPIGGVQRMQLTATVQGNADSLAVI